MEEGPRTATGGNPGGGLRFADLARRLAAAARAAGLVVPAFRSPPRRSGVPRTIRRLPGGPVVAVRVRDRTPAEIVGDLVEGVIVANDLSGAQAARMRTALVEALSAPSDLPLRHPPGWRNRQTQVA